MANANRPQGFRVFGDCKRSAEYVAGGSIYPGDVVKVDANGKVVVVSTDNTIYSSVCRGVAMSKAATGEAVLVADHPDQQFVGQMDDATVDAQTDINLNYAILGASPDTTYKISRMEIDASSQATDSTLPLRLLRIEKSVGNALGSDVDVIVTINAHDLRGGTEGI